MLTQKQVEEMVAKHKNEIDVLKKENIRLEGMLAKCENYLADTKKELGDSIIFNATSQRRIQELEAQLKPKTDVEIAEDAEKWKSRVR